MMSDNFAVKWYWTIWKWCDTRQS